MMRTPTDAEIQAAAAELGIEGPLRGRQRAKIAKVVQLAWSDNDDEEPERDTPKFARTLASTHADLIEAGLPSTAADRVVAALAPNLWRETHS